MPRPPLPLPPRLAGQPGAARVIVIVIVSIVLFFSCLIIIVTIIVTVIKGRYNLPPLIMNPPFAAWPRILCVHESANPRIHK